MKTYKIILTVIGLAFLLWFQACKKNDEPSAEDIQLEMLSATWKVGSEGSVLLDDSEVTEYFTDFSLTVNTDYTYVTTGAGTPNPWPSSGDWSFVQNSDGTLNLNKVVRDDGLLIAVELLTETKLKLSFFHDETIHFTGRSSSVSGEYVFHLNRE